MKTTILFIHSAGPQGQNQGSSNLTTYLEKELRGKYNLIHPKMPEPEQPLYVQWKEQLEKELNTLTGDVIVVGHSLGGSVLLKYLSEESYSVRISGLFVVASPYWGIDDDWQLKDFILQSSFEHYLKDIPYIFLYHSRDEEIVPFSHHKAYADKLPKAHIRELEGRQHLFHDGLPTLINDIKNLK